MILNHLAALARLIAALRAPESYRSHLHHLYRHP